MTNSDVDGSSTVFSAFIDQTMDDCLSKCRNDLHGMTRFVTWDVDGKGSSNALYRSLPTPKRMVEIYSVAVESRTKKTTFKETNKVYWAKYFVNTFQKENKRQNINKPNLAKEV